MNLPINSNGDIMSVQKDNYYINISKEPALLPQTTTNSVKQLKK